MDPDFIHAEYRQVFQADQCQLRSFDADNFNQKMAGRKLIMVGDSIMRLHFHSLACLMRSQVRRENMTLLYHEHSQTASCACVSLHWPASSAARSAGTTFPCPL